MRYHTTYEYAGICLCGLEHYSRGYSSVSEAHNDILRRCKAGVVTTGHMHSFRVTQCVRTSDDDYDYRVIYQGKVQKTKVEYTLYNKERKNNIPQNKLAMNIYDYYSDSEIRFLSLSVDRVKEVASKCAEAVNQNYSNGDSAVQTAVANASNGLVIISVTNKVGVKTDGCVCLQQWDLYGKTHCAEFLQLPVGSRKYNRINGTIKIGNLEKKIIEVHTLGNRQLHEIQGSGIMEQDSAHTKMCPSDDTPVTVTQTANKSANIVVSSAEELEDAILYVEGLVRLITAYIGVDDDVRKLLDIKDIGCFLKSKSKKLFTATINDKEIIINALSTASYKTVTFEAAKDTIYDELYCAISELLICMSLLKHDVVSSIVDAKTLTDLLQTLLQKRSLGAKSASLSLLNIEESIHDRVESSDDRQDRDESVCMTLPYGNTFNIPHIKWG